MSHAPPEGDGRPFNPYAAPQADLVAPADLSGELGSEPVRLAHVRTEGAIRALGVIAYLLAAVTLLGGAVYLASLAQMRATRERMTRVRLTAVPSSALVGDMIGEALPVVVLTTFGIAVGNGLRACRAWARWAALLMSGVLLGLVLAGFVTALAGALPSAVLIGLASWGLPPLGFFAVLANGRAAFVCSRAYRDVIARTPDIRPAKGAFALTLIAGGITIGWLCLLGFLLTAGIS